MVNFSFMKSAGCLLIILLLFVSCVGNKKSEVIQKKKMTAVKKFIPSFDYEELAPFLHKDNDKIYVVNFWATWCAPCVKELPAFEKIKSNFQSKNVEVLLVSLDFPEQIDTKLRAFLVRKKIQSEVVVLNDPDQDVWIPKINKDWSGAIPATLIYSKNKRVFFERSFEYESLEKEVLKFLK